MAISYPIILPAQGVRSIRMTAMDMVALQASPFTGQQQVQANQGQLWRADVAYPPMIKSGLADDVTAALVSLRGQYGTFLLGDSSRKTPRGLATQTGAGAYVYGASQTGSDLITRGWSVSTSQVLRAGDYIQLGATNMALRSQEINDASWVKSDVTITSNSVVAPDGTMTGDTLTSGVGSDCNVVQFISARNQGEVYTFSIWLRISFGTQDISIGVYAGNSWHSATATMTTTWQRFTVTGKNVGPNGPHISIGRATPIPPSIALYAWGAELNPGHDAGPYVATTSAAVTGTARLHKVLADVTSDANGEVVIPIWPRLRESPANGAYIKTSNCVGTFRLASNERSWDVDEAKVYGVSFSAVEAI